MVDCNQLLIIAVELWQQYALVKLEIAEHSIVDMHQPLAYSGLLQC